MGPEYDTQNQEQRLTALHGKRVGVFTPFVVPTTHITTPAAGFLYGMDLPVRRGPLSELGHDYDMYSQLGYVPNLTDVPVHVFDAMCALRECGYDVTAQQLESQIGPDNFIYIYANEGDLVLDPQSVE
jgi:hypothetical protein